MTEVIHHVSTSWCKSSTSIQPLVVQCHLQWGTLLELFQLWIAQQAVIKNPEEKGYKNQTGQPNLKCRPPHYSYSLTRHSHLRVQLGDIAFSHARTTNKDNLLPSVTPRFLSLCLWDCIPLTFKSCVYMCPAISHGDSAQSCPWPQDSLGKQGEKTWENKQSTNHKKSASGKSENSAGQASKQTTTSPVAGQTATYRHETIRWPQSAATRDLSWLSHSISCV